MAGKKSRTVKAISYDKYENITNKYILPFLNEYPMDTLNEDIINDYLEEQEEKGMSKSVAKLMKITLKGIYTYGEKNYNLRHIDFTNVNARVDKKKIDILDEHDERILYDYCQSHNDSLGVSIMLCLYGGLRFSEISALRYSDVDLNRGSINISKKVQRNVNRSNEMARTEFHTVDLVYTERRRVNLSDYGLNYLKEYMGDRNDDFYLLSNNPELKEQRKYQTELKRLGESYGFAVNYSILRNTCKQRCLANGVNISTLMSNLGLSHIDISIEDTSYYDESFNKKEMGKVIPSK